MRVDTTVVEAPIHHPTDSELCEDVIRVLSRAMRRLAQAGVDLGFKLRNVRRSVSRRMREIAQGLCRRGERAKRAIRRPYRRLLRITDRLVRQAERAAEQVQQQMHAMRGRRRRVEMGSGSAAPRAPHPNLLPASGEKGPEWLRRPAQPHSGAAEPVPLVPFLRRRVD
jgi:hypothetical protein